MARWRLSLKYTSLRQPQSEAALSVTSLSHYLRIDLPSTGGLSQTFSRWTPYWAYAERKPHPCCTLSCTKRSPPASDFSGLFSEPSLYSLPPPIMCRSPNKPSPKKRWGGESNSESWVSGLPKSLFLFVQAFKDPTTLFPSTFYLPVRHFYPSYTGMSLVPCLPHTHLWCNSCCSHSPYTHCIFLFGDLKVLSPLRRGLPIYVHLSVLSQKS